MCKEALGDKTKVKAKNIPFRVGCLGTFAYPLFWVLMWIAGATKNPENSLLKFILYLPVYPVELLLKMLAVPKGMAGMAWALPSIIMIITCVVLTGFILGYGITYIVRKLMKLDKGISKNIL